ncbi:Na+/H+ antiporter [Saccharibacillus sp. O23]|uniref:Na+/H+ antiporter n=1 Tax=Saccharibacillus sp. O23 TaxID=2009338 RepID=UPI000B4E7338|nr:Na+/H+ antiporter [Saccharibacillus sp. O23]OWR30170.1 Na+/H+ antiporter [Saccharibacillus sp. O23]
MEVFELILLMLSAIALSNLINRFIPSLSVPIIQIALGVGLTFLPAHVEVELNPELFLLLFIAPLLFNDGRMTDRKSFWSLRKPILLLALGLVFVTVGSLGYMLNALIPAIPLAAAFALAAALAPTDAIAVGALEDRVTVPHRTMKILEGESLINDASGLVSFQFAVAAMVTGTFSLWSAGLAFVGISIGGIALGLVMTFAKQIFVLWLRRLGMENVTLHMLIEVLTPFIVFLAAEKLGVNGILAAVSAGVAHSLGYRKLNPEVAKLNIVSKSTWSVIIFVLNGLVFLLLGTQLPEIVKTVWESPDTNNVQVILYTLLLTVLLLAIRYVWVLITGVWKPKEQAGESERGDERAASEHAENGRTPGKFKSALIFSLAGVRGTITLASTLSLPFILNDGSEFPQRDLIIFLAAGVILWTLLAANYLLPLLIDGEEQSEHEDAQAEMDILRNVVIALNDQANAENASAIKLVAHSYNQRILKLKQAELLEESQRKLMIRTVEWQKEYAAREAREQRVNPFMAYRFVRRLNRLLYRITHDRRYLSELRRLPRGTVKQFRQYVDPSGKRLRDRKRSEENFKRGVSDYVIEQLNALLVSGEPGIETEDIHVVLLRYEQFKRRRDKNPETPSLRRTSEEEMDELARIGIQLERDEIQRMFEAGRLSRAGMKNMKNNLLLMEHDLRDLAL